MNNSALLNLSSFFPSVGIKITGACEYKCPFCCEPNRNQDVYQLDNFIRIVDKICSSGTKRLCITGGDPLLYPQISELLKHIKTKSVHSILLSANGRLIQKNIRNITDSVSVVRISIHGTGSNHDNIVQKHGAFNEITNAVSMLHKFGVECYATTVVTVHSMPMIVDIYKWCASNGITKLFLFGLMKSGLGIKFLDKFGIVSDETINALITKLRTLSNPNNTEVIYYDYKSNAECILIYGNGNVVIDPYPEPPDYQLTIGNILTEPIETIKGRFLDNPQNVKGYSNHFYKYPKI